jgi:hypothetical protein
LSIPALAIGGEKANGEVLGQQIKVAAFGRHGCYRQKYPASSAGRKSERDN